MSADAKEGAPEGGRSRSGAGLRREDITAISVRKPAFLKSHDDASRSLARELERFLKYPDEDAVHDARTAMRRVEACVSLLPKGIRKSPGTRELLERHKRAMKKSAKVRDLDVIRGNVLRQGRTTSTARLVLRINERRKDAVKGARRAVLSARRLTVPSVGPADVTQERLQRRFEKVAGRLTKKIDGLLPVVARDPDKLKELHLLRIDCKRLRYTLELAPRDESAKVMALLKRWQDSLGAIHDWDVTTSFLREVDSSAAGELLREGIKEREREFQEFALAVDRA